MKNWKKLQRALKYASRNLGTNVMLRDLAANTGQSLFHAHRKLRAVLGETPKHFTLRLRVDRAAAALVSSHASVLDVALACGFESHEAFCRRLMGPDVRGDADLVDENGPCVGLYRIDLKERDSRKSMAYTISKHELAPQPVLVVRRRVRRAEIAATIGAELPK